MNLNRFESVFEYAWFWDLYIDIAIYIEIAWFLGFRERDKKG